MLPPPLLFDVLGITPVPCAVPSYSSPSHVVPLIASRVSLPSIPSRVPMLSLLPHDKQLLLSSPNMMLLPDTTPSTRCYIGCDYDEYIQLINRMSTAGMISFTNKPKVVNGLFGVAKPDGDIRLILDARPANSIFVTPPSVKLPSPTAFANLHIHPSHPVYVAKMDLDNFYHQLLLPEWMCPYFCLPPISVHDVSNPHALCDGITCSESQIIYPMCCTLPMGWSHSVDVAQCLHEHVLRVFSSLSPCSVLVDASSSYRPVDRLLYSSYIDDTVLLAADPSYLIMQ